MVFLALLGGCNRFKTPPKPEIVYVVAQQTYLRDRVAAVSNRVALVQNGEPLEIVERGRRFLKVKTAKNEIGWIEDHLIIEEPVYDKFVALREQHEHDPVVATGVLRDSLYLHLTPGRTTERFYLLPENDKLQLLVRTSIPKPNSQQPPLPPPKPAGATPSSTGQKAAGQKAVGQKAMGQKAAPAAKDLSAPVPMEDWWLVRDSQNHIGWLLARRMDVDIPDAIGGYSEGQKMVGAYVLNTVDDPASSLPDHRVPQYLTVLNAYKEGLAYDFDQLRVFTWNVKKHRYETAFRQRNIEGYLPVEVGDGQANHGQGGTPAPVSFAVKVASSDAATTDPGAAGPVTTQMLRFELDGNIVKKILPASGEAAAPVKPHPEIAHPRRREHGGRRPAAKS